jgi:hypothetical protein
VATSGSTRRPSRFGLNAMRRPFTPRVSAAV